MKWTEFVSGYLHFSRRDRLAVLALVALILLIFFLPTLWSRGAAALPPATDSSWNAALTDNKQSGTAFRSPPKNQDESYSDLPSYTSGTQGHPAAERFYFDPNTVSAEGWARLGLREKTIQTIQHYLAKGGHFRSPEDLAKVYGLHPDEYERLAPYVRITPATTTATATAAVTAPTLPPAEKSFPPPAKRYTAVDINLADTTAFIALPGIGSKLAARIISFREKLGGFYSIDQIGETYGLPDSTFQKLKTYFILRAPQLRKININTATLDELKAHPYIRYALANPIIAYRNEHGRFASPDELRKVMAVTEEIYHRLAPYLTTE